MIQKFLNKKNIYKMRFKKTKKKCFIIINKSHLVTIFELSILKKIFKTLNKKYFTTNTTYYHQIFCNYQATSI